MTTGMKALSTRVYDWMHRCLDCGEVVPIGIQYQSKMIDEDHDERRHEIRNRIFEVMSR